MNIKLIPGVTTPTSPSLVVLRDPQHLCLFGGLPPHER